MSDLELNLDDILEPEAQEKPAEKVLPQEEVNKLIGKVKQAAFEKGRRAGVEEAQKQHTVKSEQGNEVAESYGALSSDEVQRLVLEAQEKVQREAFAKQVASSFIEKVKKGQSKYGDFEDVVGSTGITQNLPIVTLTHNLENAEDVLYELASKPEKLANVLTLAKEVSPQAAKKAIEKLSQSIKANQDAKELDVKKPLAQIKSSSNGLGGQPTMKDVRSALLSRRR